MPWSPCANASPQTTRTSRITTTATGIIGYLRDNDLGAQAVYVYLSFDADGMLTDVDYTSQIDPEASPADNLARAEQDIATLCAPLNGLDISVATPGPPHAMQPVG